MPSKAQVERAGVRFGRLVALERAGQKTFPSGRKQPIWRCLCDCSRECEVVAGALDRGKVKSCGCLYQETRGDQNYKHGQYLSAEYRAWQAMKARCYDKKSRRYKEYGGRGIIVCDRWLYGDGKLSGVQCFLADMGPKPTLKHTMERKKTDGIYEPSNCKWATYAEQNANRRPYKRRSRVSVGSLEDSRVL